MRDQRLSGRNVTHNHDADSEACLNRQIFNSYVKMKAMEDLCARPRELIHKELRSQCLDTVTYKDIRNIKQEHAQSALLPPASSPNTY